MLRTLKTLIKAANKWFKVRKYRKLSLNTKITTFKALEDYYLAFH